MSRENEACAEPWKATLKGQREVPPPFCVALAVLELTL